MEAALEAAQSVEASSACVELSGTGSAGPRGSPYGDLPVLWCVVRFGACACSVADARGGCGLLENSSLKSLSYSSILLKHAARLGRDLRSPH